MISTHPQQPEYECAFKPALAPVRTTAHRRAPLCAAAVILCLVQAGAALAASPGGVDASAPPTTATETPSPLPCPASLAEAIAALDEGVPQVAVVKLQRRIAETDEPDPAIRSLAKTKLAEALLAAGRADDALRQIHDPEVHAPLLEAQIDAANGHWKEALRICESDAKPKTPSAALFHAECLWQLGRSTDAICLLERLGVGAPPAVLLRRAEFYLETDRLARCKEFFPTIHPVVPFEDKWKQSIEARLYLAQGRPAEAFRLFEELQRPPRDLTENLLAGATLGMTEARNQLSGPAAADDILELFIWKHPESPHLGVMFQKLDELYNAEENPSRAELEKWADREPARRAAFARYYLAERFCHEGSQERALRTLINFADSFPKHPILADALLLQGRILADQHHPDQAQSSLDAAMRAADDDKTRARVAFAAGTVHFQNREFVLAATEFHDAADQGPALWQRAMANSALSWLRQGNYGRFRDEYEALSQRFPESPLRSELVLEEGLFQAFKGDSRAETTLQRFLNDFPKNPRAPEAKLTLAELRFANNDAAGAGQYLRVANATPVSVETGEQSDYLALFVADASPSRDEAKLVTLCHAFLERHRRSVHVPEVRMKLGQVFFRRDDFAGAQTQFETLAGEAPASPLAESALFLAGQCSMKSMRSGGVDRAIELFEAVAKRNGPLKLHARLQQALAQNRLGKANEAILLFDAILQAAPPSEIKDAALAGKADDLAELGEKDHALCEQALAIYQQIASAANIDPAVRDRARYRKGRCLETLARPEEALAAYYDLIDARVNQPREYFWFYKAGFDAGRLCESQEQWKSAIGIYRKMAAIDGPRADEAKARMTRVQLEHFVWE